MCAAGCDFTTIRAAIDNPSVGTGAIIEVRDPLEKMTIQHARPNEDDCGGGLPSEGALTLRDCVVRDSMANGGGGVCSRGGQAALTAINSTIKDNIAGKTVANSHACGNGGGIRATSGTLALVHSTASGRGRGGGIHIGCGGTAVFTNTTISGNSAAPQRDTKVSRNQQGHGGGVNLHGSLRMVNCTISDNHGIGPGGGVHVGDHLDFVNTIIANNAGKGGNCVAAGPDAHGVSGSLGINSRNLVEDGTCDPAYTDDPMLGPLADNGGDTLTHTLLPDSPAIDAVPVVSCTCRRISAESSGQWCGYPPIPPVISERSRCRRSSRALLRPDLEVGMRSRRLETATTFRLLLLTAPSAMGRSGSTDRPEQEIEPNDHRGLVGRCDQMVRHWPRMAGGT